MLLLLLTSCVSTHRMEQAQAHVELGIAYFKEGSHEDALKTLNEARREDPRNWRALSALGVVYAAKGRNDLAEKSYDAALRLNPDEGEILLNKGAFLVAAGRPKEGVETLKLALQDLEYRNGALVHSNLSRALLASGEPVPAAAAAREAIRLAPGLCEAYFHLGLAQEARHDIAGALEAYDSLIETCPNEAVGAKLRRGCILAAGPAALTAKESLQDVLDAAPGTAMADAARLCMVTADGG